MTATTFCVAALAVWRLTHLLHAEAGPADALARWRAALGDGWAGRLVGCFHCLSLGVALLPLAWLAERPADALWAWPALSGAAGLAERVCRALEGPPPAPWQELDAPADDGPPDDGPPPPVRTATHTATPAVTITEEIR